MLDAVFDGGALDDLLDERIRRVFVEEFRVTRSRMLVPAVVIPEFLDGHKDDLHRAYQVLQVLGIEEVTAADGLRAAVLLGGVRSRGKTSPGAIDAIVAAMGERFGYVVTDDPGDLTALEAASRGFVVVSLVELRRRLRRAPRVRQTRRRKR